MLPGPPLSLLKARAAPGHGDSVSTGSQSLAQAPCAGGVRETQGWCGQLPRGESYLGLQRGGGKEGGVLRRWVFSGG